MKRYEKHETAITHIHAWVKSHLAPGQNLLYFGNRESLRQGIKKMKKASIPFTTRHKAKARANIVEHYRSIPTTSLRNMEGWTLDWGRLMSEGTALGVALCTDTDE